MSHDPHRRRPPNAGHPDREELRQAYRSGQRYTSRRDDPHYNGYAPRLAQRDYAQPPDYDLREPGGRDRRDYRDYRDYRDDPRDAQRSRHDARDYPESDRDYRDDRRDARDGRREYRDARREYRDADQRDSPRDYRNAHYLERDHRDRHRDYADARSDGRRSPREDRLDSHDYPIHSQSSRVADTEQRSSQLYRPPAARRPKQPKLPRLFLAIDLPNSVRLPLLSLTTIHIPSARQMDDAGYHITLHFIGNASIADVDAAVRDVRSSPFELALRSVSAFPSPRKPYTLYAAVAHCPSLLQLRSALGEALLRAGFSTDARAYKPHVTLAKLSNPTEEACDVARNFLQENNDFDVKAFPVTEFVLMESVVGSGGREGVYVRRATYPLTSAPKPSDVEMST